MSKTTAAHVASALLREALPTDPEDLMYAFAPSSILLGPGTQAIRVSAAGEIVALALVTNHGHVEITPTPGKVIDLNQARIELHDHLYSRNVPN